MQTGSSGTLIGWKSGQTTFVPLWDRMGGAWLRTPPFVRKKNYSVGARIFKRLRGPRIDFNESIPPAYVAWIGGTTTLILLGSKPP
jgi:hypothetical protein